MLLNTSAQGEYLVTCHHFHLPGLLNMRMSRMHAYKISHSICDVISSFIGELRVKGTTTYF